MAIPLSYLEDEAIRNGFVIKHGPNSYFFFDFDHTVNDQGNVVRPQGFIFYVSNDIIPCNMPACIGNLTYYWQSNAEYPFILSEKILLEGLLKFPAVSFTWSVKDKFVIKPNRVHIYDAVNNTLTVTDKTCEYLLDKPFIDYEKLKNYKNEIKVEELQSRIWKLETKLDEALACSNVEFSKATTREEALEIINKLMDKRFPIDFPF
jgi:hypothetical protein